MSCILVVICWEKADLLALLYVTFCCVLITFPYGVLGQVWYLIVSMPDRCIVPYMKHGVGIFRQVKALVHCYYYNSNWAYIYCNFE